MCNEPTTLRCKSCNSSAYCSQRCQERDWRIHKLLCKQRKHFSTPPDTNFRRAIYFPHHEEKPRFVWVPVEKRRKGGEQQGKEEEEEEEPDPTEWLGSTSFTYQPFEFNSIRERTLGDEIRLIMMFDVLSKTRDRNDCARYISGGWNLCVWPGPVLAIKRVGTGPGLYADIDVGDFRDVADQLKGTTKGEYIHVGAWRSVDRSGE